MVHEITLRRPFAHAGGFAVTAAIPEPVQDVLRTGGAAVLVEDGVALGPGDALHDDIRTSGNGTFSLWGPRLYFAASDNSDCNRNGREYALQIVDLAPGSRLFDLARQRFSGDAELLDGILRNTGRSKSLFSNFFGYFNYHTERLARHGVPLPATALELGCGDRPYTALRFLMEGVRRCVVNDIGAVETEFPAEFIAQLQEVARLVSPALAATRARLTTVNASEGRVRIAGLDACDRQPFESLALDETFDFIYSVSVLEHVMDPEAVVARMFALLAPGGHASHSIDLRDHGHFDDPLRFLRETEPEYAARKTENRLRASDWRRLFAAAGFELLECESVTHDAPASPLAHYSFDEPAGEAWVAAQRAAFAPPFADKTVGDLSTLAVRLLLRKPV